MGIVMRVCKHMIVADDYVTCPKQDWHRAQPLLGVGVGGEPKP